MISKELQEVNDRLLIAVIIITVIIQLNGLIFIFYDESLLDEHINSIDISMKDRAAHLFHLLPDYIFDLYTLGVHLLVRCEQINR